MPVPSQQTRLDGCCAAPYRLCVPATTCYLPRIRAARCAASTGLRRQRAFVRCHLPHGLQLYPTPRWHTRPLYPMHLPATAFCTRARPHPYPHAPTPPPPRTCLPLPPRRPRPHPPPASTTAPPTPCLAFTRPLLWRGNMPIGRLLPPAAPHATRIRQTVSIPTYLPHYLTRSRRQPHREPFHCHLPLHFHHYPSH